MLKSIGAFRFVRFTEVVRISESPLREVLLYTDVQMYVTRTTKIIGYDTSAVAKSISAIV